MRGELKLDRASAHVGDLRCRLDEYKHSVGDALSYFSTAADGGIEYFRGNVPAPPTAISLVLGDFLQAARAALDHAIFSISIAVKPDYVRQPAFPIVLNEARYDAASAAPLKYIPDEISRVVRRFQPFAAAAGRNDPLAQLDELAAIDRHRQINLLASVVEADSVGWTGTVMSDDWPDVRLYGPAVAVGELLVRVPSRVEEPNRVFTPSFELSVVIGEGDRFAVRPEVFGLATEIRGRVREALVELDRVATQLAASADSGST
jgi:hypothetical protein